jgi:hypothetical protein
LGGYRLTSVIQTETRQRPSLHPMHYPYVDRPYRGRYTDPGMNILSYSIPEPADWAGHELEAAEFGDRRLSRRLATLVTQLSDHPASSVPQATGSWAAAQAAYRFWSSETVTPASLLAPHAQRTFQRCRGQTTSRYRGSEAVHLAPCKIGTNSSVAGDRLS